MKHRGHKHTDKAIAHLRRAGYAAGGSVHSDEAADKRMIDTAVHKHERHDHKGKPLTKLARGGSAKHKGATKVNVIVAPQGGAAGARPVPVPVPIGGPRPGMAPPVVPPGAAGAMPPGAGLGRPGMPGPMPGAAPGMRPPGMKRGGKVPHLKGGAGGGLGRLEKIKAYGARGR